MLGGLKQNLVHIRTQGPHRDWARPAFEWLSVSCRGTGQQWPATGAGALSAADLGVAELQRTWGTDSWRAQTKPCVHQDPGERSSDPMRDWPGLSHGSPAVSGGGVGQRWPAAGLGALSAAVPAWDPLKEVPIIFITSTIVWPQVKQQGRNTALTSTENWIKDLLSMFWWAGPIRPSFPLSQSLPSGSFHKTLILLYQRADRMKTKVTEN